MDKIDEVMEGVSFGITSYNIIEEIDTSSCEPSFLTSTIRIRITTLEGTEYVVIPSPLGFQVS